jgi:hypothetical protein
MGRPSIAEMRKTQNEVQDYLDEIRTKLSAKVDSDLKTFTEGTTDYYKTNNWDFVTIGRGDHRDFRQVESFSLDLVADIVGNVAKGFFSTTPVGQVAGAVDSTKTAAMPASILALGNIQALALSATMTLISNVLGLFSTKTSITYNQNGQRLQIAPGLTLHILLYTETYDSNGAFVSKSIVQDAMTYQLIYSAAEEKLMGLKGVLDADFKLLEEANATLITMNETFDALNLDPNATDDAIANYTKRIDNFMAQRDLLLQNLNESKGANNL